MQTSASLWTPVSALKNDTALIFGYAGTPYLEVAIDRASQDGDRPVAVIAAANPAAVRDYAERVEGVASVTSTEDLNALIDGLGSGTDRAIVFYGLAEYANRVLDAVCGDSNTAEQREWGEMARIVSNDLIRLAGVAPVLYVTCDVIDAKDNKTKSVETRLNINPGLQKLILNDLHHKWYVSLDRTGEQTLVQENAALALKFREVRDRPPQDDPATDASARPAQAAGRRRRR